MATTRTSSAGKVSFGSWESEKREHPQGCSFFCALSSARGFCSPKGLLFYFSRTVRECALRGIFSFSKENIPLTPPRERIFIASEQLEELQCLPIAPLACGRAAFGPAIRFASASTTRCCAAVGGSAALRMRHTPCGCRSAHLVEVRSNHRLPPVATMRRAPAMPLFRTQSAAVLPSLAPHNSKARLRVVTRR